MSFRLKTILGIASIEILLLAILVISGLTYLRGSTEDQLLNRANTTARLFASMTTDAVVSLDLATLDALIKETLENPGVIYARVRRNDGAILAQGGDPKALKAPFVPDTTVDSARSDARLDVSHDIVVAGRNFGHVEIGVSTAALNATISAATFRLLLVAGMEIVLVAIFGFILGGILTKQLSLIQKGARLVAEGQFGYQIDVSGKDEVADTARSFNRMSAALADYARELTEARERAESVLHDAVESAPQGILVLDGNGSVLLRNSAYPCLYPNEAPAIAAATTFQEIAGITSRLAVPQADDPAATAEHTDAVVEIPTLPDPRNSAGTQSTVKLADGRCLYRTMRPMQRGGWVVVETDVTPLYEAQEKARKLELELLQAGKLEALGTLAGGIAHEINTPIQYIGDNLRFLDDGFASLVSLMNAYDDLLSRAEATESLHDLAESLKRARDASDTGFLLEEIPQAARQSIDGVAQVSRIVLAMKEFAYPSAREMTDVDMNAIIERATTVCRGEWKNHASLDLQLDPTLPKVPGMEGELNQVILNMVVNASQAIAERGVFPGTITIRTARDDGGIAITIEDTGSGIPDAVRSRIFEPFFTTKPVGKGTGQGLAICRDVIVSKHGGRIDIIRANGNGTAFRIHLPGAQPEQEEPTSERAAEVVDIRMARR